MALFPSFLQPLFACALLLLAIWLEFFREKKTVKKTFFSFLHLSLALVCVACLLRRTIWVDSLSFYLSLESFLQGFLAGSLLSVLSIFHGETLVSGKKRLSLLKLPWLFALAFLTVMNTMGQAYVAYLQWLVYLIPLPLLYNHTKLKRVFNHYGLFVFSLSLANLISFNTVLSPNLIEMVHNFFWTAGLASIFFGLNTLEEVYE
jgi:hypothetical protein